MKTEEQKQQEMLRIHQEMLGACNACYDYRDSEGAPISYYQVADWFNTIKECWPWQNYIKRQD